MNWITKQLSESLNDYIDEGLSFFKDAIIAIFDQNVEIFSSAEITSAELIIKAIAIVLVIVMTLKQIFSTYVMETDGDPDSDPMQLLVKISISLALIEGNSLIFDICQELSRDFTGDLVGSCNAKDFCIKMDSLLQNMVGGNAPILLIVCAICLIMLIVFIFKSGIRGGELMLMRLLLPLFALDKLTANQERWNAFFTSYMVTFFSYGIQLFCIRCGIGRIISALTEGLSATFTNYFAGLVLFFLAIKTPKWLEKFVYSSGLGQMTMNTGRSLTYMIPTMLMRRG